MPYGSLALDTITSSGNLAITGNFTVTGNDTANTYNLVSQTLGTATPGRFEYDGTVGYFTPIGTQRGVVPGMQYYRLNSTVAGSNATGAQSIFGVGASLSASTVYAFEFVVFLTKTAGLTSHTMSLLIGGTATFNNIFYSVIEADIGGGFGTRVNYSSGSGSIITTNVATATVVTGAMTSATQAVALHCRGTVSINAAGTFIPQYSLSVAPGGAYTTQIGSYVYFYPIGASGANTSVGTWA